jgi:cytochrome bd-type quinol oxidase subunit 2
MTPTTQVFAWDGFFRSLQGDFMSLAGLLVLIAVALLVGHWLLKWSLGNGVNDEEARAARLWAGRIATIVTLCAVGVVVWRAVSLASVNRMPRADLDRSEVYQQMKSLEPPR